MTFKCGKCHKDFQKVKHLQPVASVSYGKICQHCWCALVWGEKWADECRAKDDRMWPSKEALCR